MHKQPLNYKDILEQISKGGICSLAEPRSWLEWSGIFYDAEYNLRHHVVTWGEALFVTAVPCCITDASTKRNYEEINLTFFKPAEHKSDIFNKDRACKK